MVFAEELEMSGTSIPYHLRQNKAIDRFTFIDLLLKIDKSRDISKYTYIGFGGHSLEDFKYMHSQFGICNMISIEENEEVFKRQRFNRPTSCITSTQQNSSDFISSFTRTQETIIWLDYTKPSELLQQITELQSVLQSLSTFDIVRITLNANPSALEESSRSVTVDELQQNRLEKLRARLGDLFPSDITPDFMTHRGYPKALCSILKLAVNSALEGQHDVYFQPLTAFSYSDGQQMFTLTGILLEESEEMIFFQETGIRGWQLSNTNWDTPKQIDIPDFTIKERLWVDSLLPDANAEAIHNDLGFWFDNSQSKSLSMLETYILFYRRSPLFTRIFV